MSQFHLMSAQELPAGQLSSVSMEVLVTCLRDCPAAPASGSQVHYTFDIKVSSLQLFPHLVGMNNGYVYAYLQGSY